MANITIIPPKEAKPEILRVAAYCRVSTDSSEQELSYASQIRSYTELISQHDGWELVDIYADSAASGTRTEQRDDFNRMLADCRKGQIDKVLVKSISRFSRNTKDCLAALRELMQLGVTVQFEKENIDTNTLTTELMVSVSASLAQQESISISENNRMAYRRRMERGEFITNKPPYGYRNAGGGKLEIVPEEAEIVRWVFASYLSGHSMAWIAKELTHRGVPKKYGKDRKSGWGSVAVRRWLSNEKYTGDTLCQKTFSTGFPFTTKINNGELNQFYVENTHPAIISHEVFDKVQALRHRNIGCITMPSSAYPLSKKIICGNCGASFYRQIYRPGTAVWICERHHETAEYCQMGRILENAVYTAFVRMYNKLRLHSGIILKPAIGQLDALASALRRKNPAMLEINRAIAQATDHSYKITRLQANGLLDADASAAKIAALNAQLTQLRVERRRLLRNDDIADAAETLRQTVNTLNQGPAQLAVFDENLFMDLVEQITAESGSCIRFRLYGGIELTEYI